MPLKRIPDWDTHVLHDFLAARAKMPFAWGTNDCCLFPADGIQAMTGVDLAAELRGKYASREEAFALIKTVTGGSTVADAAAWCASKAGLTERPNARFAGRGDLVVVKVASDDGTELAGLVGLTGQVLAMSEKRPLRLPITSVVRCWQV